MIQKRLWLLMALLLVACASPATPTLTSAPPTATALPPTATRVPPTATATTAPSDTPLPTETTAPTATPLPSDTPAPTETLAPSNTPTLAGPVDYTPAASVWNFAQGPDQIGGVCSGTHLPPYGLAQIAPDANGLTWRSQEIAPYAFVKVKTNVYSYSGPTAAGDGAVVMTLTFNSATTLVMRRTFSPNAEPGCSHTHDYRGTFQWLSQ